jgi:uroporphyrinogen-III synthase
MRPRITATVIPGGDPGWLTVRALRRLEAADVVVFDQDMPPGGLPDTGAARIPVANPEEAIRAVLEEGRRGHAVVRLASDLTWPRVRTEELPAWRAAGLPVSVLPGVDTRSAVDDGPRGGLDGWRVLVLRQEGQDTLIRELLEEAGAAVLSAPVLAIEAPSWADADPYLLRLSRYQWLVFTSANGVSQFFGRLWYLGGDIRETPARLAAVGPETRRRLEDLYLRVALVPEGEHSQDGLVEAFRQVGIRGQNVLIATGNRRRPHLAQGLRAMGAMVDEAIVYQTVARTLPAWVDEAFQARRVDAVLFTSGSTADFLAAQLSPDGRAGLADAVRVSIGPATSRTLAQLGLPATVEARTPSMASLVEALERYALSGADTPHGPAG